MLTSMPNPYMMKPTKASNGAQYPYFKEQYVRVAETGYAEGLRSSDEDSNSSPNYALY